MEDSARAFVEGSNLALRQVHNMRYNSAVSPDVAGEARCRAFAPCLILLEPHKKGASNVYSDLANTASVAVWAMLSVNGWRVSMARRNTPRRKKHRAIGNAGNLALALIPIKGILSVDLTTTGQTLKTTGKVAAKTTAVATKPLIKSAAWGAKKLDDIADDLAKGVSRTINRADIPKQLQKLDDAELLFVKTLADEGVSFDGALRSLSLAKQYKATPSVAVTAQIPQMQTQGYLMSRGSSGSRLQRKAIENIDKVQIPSLNKEIIKQATGGMDLPAEKFGQIVSQEAKKLVDAKKLRLKTRAAPHYANSVGVDKMIPIKNDLMKRALSNRLVVKALDDFRSDPYTLSRVAEDLAELGIDAGDISKLPYNSTVSMHAARVGLRRASDEAFRSGDKIKYGAVKSAMNDIDNAIESAFPSYKQARAIYSEDAGALKVLMDSPVGRMSTFAEGNFSKIANDLATKDPQFIKKFMIGIGDNQKMRDAVAGAYINRIREEARFNGRRLSDALFKSEGSAERLKALVGQSRYNQMEKVNNVIESLISTRSIPSQSITAAAQSVKGGLGVPKDALSWIKDKISPDLINIVQRDPAAAARFNELMFTDEGFKFLEKMSGKTKQLTPKDVDQVVRFLNKNTSAIVGGQ